MVGGVTRSMVAMSVTMMEATSNSHVLLPMGIAVSSPDPAARLPHEHVMMDVARARLAAPQLFLSAYVANKFGPSVIAYARRGAASLY